MGNYPFNRTGQLLGTDAPGISVEEVFTAHQKISAANAVVASASGVATANLGVAIQTQTTGITNPGVPKTLSVTGNVSGVTGNVTVTGKSFDMTVITETIALNGTATVAGAKAFRTVDSIALPAQVHTPVKQVETATLVGTVTGSGNATVTVTSAVLAGSPKAYSVPVLNTDTPTIVAGKVAVVLAADAVLTALFAVTNPVGAPTTVVLTSVLPNVNDSTLNVASATGTATGITTAASSVHTTAGVPYDIVSVGFTEVLGIPYKLSRNTIRDAYLNNVKESTAPTVTVNSTAIESNTIKLNSTLNGSVVDIYLIV